MNKKYSLKSNYKYIYSSMWSYDKKLILYGIIEIILLVIVPLIQVALPSMVIGLLEAGVTLNTFITYVLYSFIGFGIIFGLSVYFQNRNNSQYVMIRSEIFLSLLNEKCITMNYELLEQEETQKKFQKASRALWGNSVGIEGFMHTNVDLAINILGLIIYALIASSINPLIFLLLISISLIHYFVFTRARNYEMKQRDKLALLDVNSKYYKDLGDDINGGKDIRLYKLQNWIMNYYGKTNKEKQKIISKQNGYYYLYDLVGVILQFFRDLISYGYLIYLLTKGMSIYLFVLYSGIIAGFSTWFTKISEDIAKVTRFSVMISDYRLFLDEGNLEGGTELLEFNKYKALDIVFDHVSYKYKNSDELILDNLSFHIKDGEKLALVGINGAGKTTIVKLLCGFYKPCSGYIYINGIDINKLNHSEYLNHVAVILQNTFTFSYSIADNISCSSKVDEELLNKCIKKSGLENKINSLPEKINTHLNKDIKDNGIILSGGETQKLMLARALYKESKMLILDEPTAALDSLSESMMYEKYNELTKNHTSLFISHRLSSTKFCDNIIYLENGKIIEEGTHEELLKLDGKYAEMFKVQSQYYKKDGDSNEVQRCKE